MGQLKANNLQVNHKVIVSAKDFYLRLGDFANIKLTKAYHYDLYGDVIY